MNVYDMGSESGEAGDKWVHFYTRHKVAMPGLSWERSAFFAAHPRIEVMRNNQNIPRGTKQQLGDYSNLSHDVHPVFSDRAKQALAPHLQGLGQWIELVPDYDPTYWLFYITKVIDALDVEKSEVVYFPSTPGKVMAIDRFVFKPEAVQDQLLFTLLQRPGSNRCVTDRFVELARQHGLTGLEFKLLWSSDSKQKQPTARVA
jgi:hypothetical protein